MKGRGSNRSSRLDRSRGAKSVWLPRLSVGTRKIGHSAIAERTSIGSAGNLAGYKMRIYPNCPSCKGTMSYLLQLDSNLPAADGYEWLWGSGGMAYGFWCDACTIKRISLAVYLSSN